MAVCPFSPYTQHCDTDLCRRYFTGRMLILKGVNQPSFSIWFFFKTALSLFYTVEDASGGQKYYKIENL